LSAILARLLRASAVTRPRPERLIRMAVHCGQSRCSLLIGRRSLCSQEGTLHMPSAESTSRACQHTV
jgi:hypothetical protein